MATSAIFLIILVVVAGILLIAAIALMAYNEHHRYGRAEAEQIRQAAEQHTLAKANKSAVAPGRSDGHRE
ncbi:hypothetical protein [Mycobacteroides franklinii]|uniref:Uncharacterized protein n=1 Tax=Mycobacteroides franklinii TaxID=948102 RepID=A0A1S1L0H3_9MYCO|nr:hypothetical protein [Mycobacteroides franklinii]OHU19152.1 hypothetical protein BKG76_22000 [Mycobacteroides franklinii]